MRTASAETSVGLEWALLWSPNQLANQLESPASGTLVHDRDGRVQGMVNYHYLTLQGRVPVRAALIDLWAEDDLTSAQRVRLLGHLCNELRGRDVQVVLALRSTMMPAAAFVANVFLPQQHGYLCVLSRGAGTALSPPNTWSLVMR